MASDQLPQKGQKNTTAASVFAELSVVGLVLFMMLALTASIIIFLTRGNKTQTFKPDSSLINSSISRAEPAKIKPETPVKLPEPPAAPDESLAELKLLEKQLQAARQARVKADLMAWVAEKSSAFLESSLNHSKKRQQSAQKLLAALQQSKKSTEDTASLLADEIARLELERESAETSHELAKNFKGYSILPYRGPNGTWHRPLPIECTNETAQIMPGGPSFRLIDLELAGMSGNSVFSRIIELAMRKAAAQATPDGNAPTVYVLFVVRPSGIKAYYEARARLQAQGVAFGYELVDEKTPIEYPDLGDLTEWPGYTAATGIASVGSVVPGETSNRQRSTRSGTNNATTPPGSVKPDGLYVWKNGLGGSRGPGGLNNETAMNEGLSDSIPRSRATANVNELGQDSGPESNDSALSKGRSRSMGEGVDGPGQSPRVDFGPGTLSQLGRSPGGGTQRSPEASNSAIEPNLSPPWGNQPDPRRGGDGSFGNGRTGNANAGTKAGKPGTFSDLVAELNASEGNSVGKLANRPGAVAIMPGDLADDGQNVSSPSDGSSGLPPSGNPIASERNGIGPPGGMPTAPSLRPGTAFSRSPFGTNVPTLPRFEPAPGSPGSASSDSHNASSTGSNTPPLGTQSGSSGNAGSSNPPAIAGSSGASASAGGGSAGNSGSGSGESSSDDKPQRNQGFGLRRLFGGDNKLPEKAWEISLYCDADGLTIRPGEHRLRATDLQGDADLLPRTLQAMFEKQLRDHPERFWRPYIRYRLASGGDNLMATAQQQIAEGFIRWPALVEKVASAGALK